MSGLSSLLRASVGADVASFRLMGEDLALVTGARLREAAAAYDEGLRAVPEPLRGPFELEQARFQGEAHAFLRRYNTSLRARVAGYMALGERCAFAYPWPVVAILGICQVMTGMDQNRRYGLAAGSMERMGMGALARIVDRSDDVLRRTNRGIFADSAPTMLFGLRLAELRRGGDGALADALSSGPLPPIFDETSRAIAGGLARALAIGDEQARFRALADQTLIHFDREQAIFSHHIGPKPEGSAPSGPQAALLARLFALRAVPAPVVVQGRRGRRLAFHDFPLPEGFDIRDHAARVDVFGRAFVRSVTGDRGDYDVAKEYVAGRFGKRK